MPDLNELVADARKHLPELADAKVKKGEDLELLDKHESQVKAGLYRVMKLAESASVQQEVSGGSRILNKNGHSSDKAGRADD